jgi:hypothetical protein
MRIFYDTEFIDCPKRQIIELISIGMIREDGTEYYAEVDGVDWGYAVDWVLKNVKPHLEGPSKPRQQIAREIQEFVGPNPEFWGYYAAYDWVALCQLYGRMLDTPDTWPNFTHDVQALRHMLGITWRPEQKSTAHHALNDARWTKEFFDAIRQYQAQVR